MSVELPDWPRSQYQPGGEAFVFFAVYGEFSPEVRISGARYRTTGVPPGFEVRKLDRAQTPDFPFSTGAIGDLLQPKQPALFNAMQRADECMIIQGVIPDSANLNYLRDAVGLVMFFLEHGGIAALDPQQFRLYDSARWRADLFEPNPPQLNRHVVILVSDETGAGDGCRWIHTRGLRKFGRPDLSLRHVPREMEIAALELCNRFIQTQAQGGVIPEGEEIRMGSLPRGLVCHHGGSVDDPDFNNVHVEIKFPQ